jgi:hypothetical protein
VSLLDSAPQQIGVTNCGAAVRGPIVVGQAARLDFDEFVAKVGVAMSAMISSR